jgi:hypothetical protein
MCLTIAWFLPRRPRNSNNCSTISRRRLCSSCWRAARHLLHQALYLIGHDLAPLRNELIRQHVLELHQVAAHEHRLVVA